ncbi:MAG: Wzz/FepE/Etk N-terminal domain-containing protein [Clostridia bacterium]|nr:Wzz/FepE/Etk N-terminal domain-containing protein [Clostridia bacterium]
MENQNFAEINLLDLLFYIRKKIWIPAVAVVVCSAIVFVISSFVLTPSYTASTRIYILNRSEGTAVNYSDIQSSTQLANDYEALITGRNVTAEVIKDLDLDISNAELAGKIKVTNQEDTRIMQINVTDSDPELAAKLANKIRDVAQQQIVDIMEIDAVNVVYAADVPTSPSAPNTKKNVILAAGIALVLSLCALTVLFVADDTVKTEEDAERYLQLATLGTIPYSRSMGKGSSRTKKRTGKEMGRGKTE